MTRSGKPPDGQDYADRTYRSASGIVSGALLIAVCLWIGGDALVRGSGRTPWFALAGLLVSVPLVVAYTVRPVVLAGNDRMTVRNPFRTVTVPWAAVEGLRSGFSNELFAGGKKYQLWAVPVSLRERKRVNRAASRAAAGGGDSPARARGDKAVDELRELAERNAGRPGAQGEPSVRWSYEIIAPAAVGLAGLAVLLATG